MKDQVWLGELAADALRVEARLTPKPGLVDTADDGAHADMDLELMLASADALEPYFFEASGLGLNPVAVRDLGLRATTAMLEATGGVNTHLGAIYSLGLLCAAAGTGASGVEAICSTAARLAIDIVMIGADKDHPARLESTRASAAALGLGGARAEAASGFELVRHHGLPTFERRLALGWDEESALLAALVSLMAWGDDTNLVARGGFAALATVKGWAQAVETDVHDPAELRRVLASANATFVARNWSPGGSADLLGVTWWLSRVGGELELESSSRVR